MTGAAVTGQLARELAARLTAHGYRARFPPGRDVAVFQVTGLAGDPYVEVCAEDDGCTGCHYTGRTAAGAAEVIARLPATMPPGIDVGSWSGIEVEWHYIPSDGHTASADHIARLLLAHMAVLDGGREQVTAAEGDA